TQADRIVSSTRQGVQKCRNAEVAQQKYQAAKKEYDRDLAGYHALKHKHGANKPTGAANPGAVPSNCPAGANGGAGGSSGSTGTGSPSTGPASPSTSGSTP